MSADLATLVAPQVAADRPLPRFACPVSRRIGVLQFEIREWQRRRREAQEAFRVASVAIAQREEELDALLQAERAEVTK